MTKLINIAKNIGIVAGGFMALWAAANVLGTVYAWAQPIAGQYLSNGQLIIGSTGAAPVAAALTGSTAVSVTNGAGSITLDLNSGGVATAKLGTASVTSAKLDNGAVTTAKMYLDLESGYVPCVTTAHLLGQCRGLTATDGTCGACY